ncbi:hypothetical protein WDZ92_20300 [Nostoc sp. NIES-2111]
MRIFGIDDLPEPDKFTLRTTFRLPHDVWDAATAEEMAGVSAGTRCILFDGHKTEGRWLVMGYPFVTDAQEFMRAHPRSYVYVMIDGGEHIWPSAA